ncbi:arabinofuranosidase catalytic domain-containing protein [Streptomyces sp. SS7]|uniref:arabinofuranosidase catalytic domain-containing protein n=1 Tax=Streptomyces sp. SS7 TaxID=3108485 RepID=UPI0030ED38CA
MPPALSCPCPSVPRTPARRLLPRHSPRRVRRAATRAAACLTALCAALLALLISPVPASAAGTGPCDLYASGGTACIAAHSTVRALYGAYGGPLYQVRRASDNATRNIGVTVAGGPADAAAQDSFCAGTTCVITWVYDQSGHGNHLGYQGPGGVGGSDTAAKATSESLTVGGRKAYSLYINAGNSYWRDGHSTGVPTGSAPEGMYMVTSGTHVNSGCCFDYGNSETTRKADGPGAMDAINFSKSCWFGGCSGTGPWVQADLEWGLYPGGSTSWNPNQRAYTGKFVTAMLKNNGTSRFAIKGGDAQSGGLTTLYAGSLPGGYSPMRKQGAIILGSGGDCCNGNTNLSIGTFYEGAITAGYPSDATDNAVQANITAAGYR